MLFQTIATIVISILFIELLGRLFLRVSIVGKILDSVNLRPELNEEDLSDLVNRCRQDLERAQEDLELVKQAEGSVIDISEAETNLEKAKLKLVRAEQLFQQCRS